MIPKDVNSYLQRYGPQIAQKVRDLFQARHNPSKDQPYEANLLRPPLPAQAHAMTAIAKAWKHEKSVILSAECGTGKSLMMAASCQIACQAHAKGRPYRVLIFAPDHLVDKWQREIKMTIPNADVMAIHKWQDTFTLPQGKPDRPFYCVLGRNTSKWLSMWRAAYTKRGKTLYCPKCGQALIKKMEEDGEATFYTEADLNKKKTKCPNDGCNEQLWQYYPKIERWSPAKIIHDRYKYYFDYFILDECFVGDTLVFMENQEYKEISKIQPGDVVMSYDHKTNRRVTSKVVRVIENPTVEPLVKVTHSKGSFVCTERHHIYANGKYIAAGKLSKGDVLYAASTSMPSLRQVVHSKTPFQGDVLRQKLRSKDSRGETKTYPEELPSLQQGIYSLEEEPTILQQKMLVECTVGESCLSSEDDAVFAGEKRESTACMFREHEEEKQRPRISPQVCCVEKREMVWDSRRERQGNDDSRASFGDCFELETGCCSHKHEPEGRIPNTLQSGCRESSPEGGNRTRRSISRFPEDSREGPEERKVSSFSGMDDASLQERGGIEFASRSDGEDQDCIILSVEYSDREDECVYDLEVENTHCYFAGGVLVHNCQEVKSDDNLQANAAGTLIASCKKVIAGTGTLIGGYAKDVRAIMFRLVPHSLKAEGLTWENSMEFNRRYGLIETTHTTRSGGESSSTTTRNGRGKSNSSKNENVKPGTMPTLYARHLIGSTVFLSLKDVASALPSFREIPVAVPLGDIEASYKEVETTLRATVKEMLKKKNKALLGKMLHTLLCYPDYPYNWKEIGYWQKERGSSEEFWVPVITPPALPSNKVYPKEKKLLEIIREEKKQGRQVWVFVEYTGGTKGDHPVRDRIAKIVQLAGFSVKTLDSDRVKLVDREKWISENGAGVDVILSHPTCVATGLDFFDKEKTYNFPSIVFYEEGYSLVPMRQAGRRAWRIGQLEECRVYYLYYEGSMQARAMNLMGRKMAESLAIEGNFSSDGLDAILADHDTASMELAKSLSEQMDFGETERCWKKVDAVENDSPKRKPLVLPPRVMDKSRLLEALRAIKAQRERTVA